MYQPPAVTTTDAAAYASWKDKAQTWKARKDGSAESKDSQVNDGPAVPVSNPAQSKGVAPAVAPVSASVEMSAPAAPVSAAPIAGAIPDPAITASDPVPRPALAAPVTSVAPAEPVAPVSTPAVHVSAPVQAIPAADPVPPLDQSDRRSDPPIGSSAHLLALLRADAMSVCDSCGSDMPPADDAGVIPPCATCGWAPKPRTSGPVLDCDTVSARAVRKDSAPREFSKEEKPKKPRTKTVRPPSWFDQMEDVDPKPTKKRQSKGKRKTTDTDTAIPG